MESEAVFIVDKPVGPTSFDVVRAIKKIYPKEKVGHAGSLDPFATGALIILLGKATKFSDALLNSDKRYVATLKLGSETDSLDLTGRVIAEAPVPPLTLQKIEECIQGLVGIWEQTPPMYSAKKVNGVRLYQLARQNVSIEREKVPVHLYELRVLQFTGSDLVFEVHCSKGTYIRSLGQEIAKRLGTVGHLTALRRLSCGAFQVEQGVTVEQIQAGPEEVRKQGFHRFNQIFGASPWKKGAFLKSQNPQLPRGVINGNSLGHI